MFSETKRDSCELGSGVKMLPYLIKCPFWILLGGIRGHFQVPLFYQMHSQKILFEGAKFSWKGQISIRVMF